MTFSLTCTALNGTNKAGLIKADAAGYYEMVIGAFDVPNSRGDIYTAESARRLFKDSKLLMRRSDGGYLRGEYGHPKREVGQSVREFISRNHEIDERYVSHLFKEVWLDEKNIRDESGSTIIAVMALVKPTGPYGDVLAKQIESDENVAFSIRCFCDDKVQPNGTLRRSLRNIITWDYVNEPGIKNANKYASPACESLRDILTDEEITEQMIYDIAQDLRKNPIACESERYLRINETLESFKITSRVKRNDLNSSFRNSPKSFNW